MKYAWIILAAALAGCASIGSDSPRGAKPSYLDSFTDAVPNAAALGNRIYTPALDEDYVPQGLTSDGGYPFVSSYKPTPDLKANTGPCRIFRIEMATGKSAGAFDIPPGTCTHAGGLAHMGNGKLFVSDTRQVFLIDVAKALASGTSAGASNRLDRQGNVKAEYDMVTGLEDLTIDDAGRLWGMSESGTRKYIAWETRYPYIFQIDVGKLK